MTAEASDASPGAAADRLGRWTEAWRATAATDQIALGLALALVVAFAPPLLFEGWTPRMVVLLAGAPFGVALVAALCLRRDRSAIALAFALAACLVSALVSGNAHGTVLGVIGRDLSWLTLLGSAGLWAIGRSVTSRGRAAVEPLVIVALAVSALIGVLQVLLDVQVGSLALLVGRPTGLTSNPVYFGALSVVVSLLRWRIVTSHARSGSRRSGCSVRR